MSEAGVGFGNYHEYLRNLVESEKAQKEAQQAAVSPGPKISDESTAPAPTQQAAEAPVPAQEPTQAASADPLPEAGRAPVPDDSPLVTDKPSFWDKPTNTYAAAPNSDPSQNPTAVTDNNSFEKVTSERSRQQDAARLQRNREQYVIIEPTELPKRPGSDVPNIVAYAVATTNPPGTQLYKRGPFDTQAASARACARYVSADTAQEAFLKSGGPKRDPKKLDPDGDGFACEWDPTVFRSVKK